MADIVCITTADGTLRFVNRAGRELLGYGDADPAIIGTLFPTHSAAARELLLDEVIPAAMRNGQATSDTALLSADGRIFPASQTVVVGAGDDTTPLTLTIVVRNVGLERQASTRMAESQRLFEMIARGSPDLIYLYDPHEQRIVWMNRCVHAFLGGAERDARTLDKREMRRLVHRDDRDALRDGGARMSAAYGDSDLLTAQFRIRTPGGSWRWVHTRANVFSRRETGAPLLLLGITSDVTADRKEVDRLVAMRDTANQSSRTAHAFVDDLTASCQDALYAVVGLAAELRDNREGRLNPRELDRLDRLTAHATALLATVSDVREYEQLESGGVAVTQTLVDVPALLADTIGSLAPHADRAGIAVTLEVPTQEIAPVLTDAARLRQALSQIIAAAVAHGTGDDISIALRCDADQTTPLAIEVRVAAPALAGSRVGIFTPFRTAGHTKRGGQRPPSSRFGLALAQALCQTIGGSLQHVVAGQASVFRLALPVRSRAARLAAAYPTPSAGRGEDAAQANAC